ncbi:MULTISPECIES: NAD-dependent epimerase/dehydratase family protein [Chitinophagaceae]
MKVLVTGAAGFIGFHLVERLITLGNTVVGIDNINDYYDIQLKYGRLKESGIIEHNIEWNREYTSAIHSLSYKFIRMNLEDKPALLELCEKEAFDVIINLAAQAGVRYSIKNPDAYIQSNIVGFLNILEAARQYPVKHFLYASSSSVYGLNTKMPFSVIDNVDYPVSLYAATKKSNELIAHSYSHLYDIPCSGLRFFTVYGPWGRPDMAYFSFSEAIRHDTSIKVFNHGKLKRDFTYIDDIIDGIIRIMSIPPTPHETEGTPASYRICNLGNNQPVELFEFIKTIADAMGKEPKMEMLEMQPGDVLATWADIDDTTKKFGYVPKTSLREGMNKFVEWYKDYNNRS